MSRLAVAAAPLVGWVVSCRHRHEAVEVRPYGDQISDVGEIEVCRCSRYRVYGTMAWQPLSRKP